MNFVKYIVFLICFQAIGQQLKNPLPIVKNGRWYLFDGIHEIELPKSYTYVNTFDEKGTALFSEGNNHGLIDSQGHEISKSIYKDLEQIGNGIFKQSTLKGYEIFTADRSTRLLCNWLKKIDENWMVYFYDTTTYLLNLNWKNGKPIHSSFDIQKSILNYLILKSGKSNYQLFDPKGILLDSSDATIKVNENNFYYKGTNAHIYVDVFGKWDVPKNSKNFQIEEFTLIYTLDNKTRIISKNSKKTIVEAICDNIFEDGENYKINKGSSQGLIDKNGKVLIPPVYDVFFKIPNGYYLFKNQLKGYMNSYFKEKIPCQFKEIYFDKNFIFTETYLGGKGLLNAQTYEEILSAYYSKLLIDDNLIKAYGSDKLVILQLNENKTIKNKIILDHVISINPNMNLSSFNFDRRLLSIGWYFDTISVFDKQHNWLKTELKWGIKNNQDSILLKSSLRNPRFIENAPISIVKAGEGDIKLFNFQFVKKEVNFYSIYIPETGKKSKVQAIFDIDTTDFINREYARFVYQNGYGFYFRDHAIKLVDYIEQNENEIIRYCNFNECDKQINSNKISVSISGIYFNEPISNNNSIPFEFKNAKWNFMNKSGDSLFKEPFEFAHNYYLNTAIVKGKNGWGVVNKDSIIISEKYADIERIKELGDTIFKVQITQKGKRYFDSTFTQNLFENYQFEKENTTLSIFSKKGEYSVIDANNSILNTSVVIPKLKENGTFIVKDKKYRKILDSSGNELISLLSNPIEVLKNDACIVENQNKFGIISFNNDTLLPITHSEIISSGNYIIAKKDGFTFLYSDNLKEIKKIKSGNFLIDYSTNNWMQLDFPKIQIFNQNGEKISGWKIEEKVINFYNNIIFTSKGILYDLNGNKINLAFEFIDFKCFEDDYIALKDHENKWHLYNSKWELLSDDELKNRNIIYHGDHVFSMSTKNGLMVYDFIKNKQYNQFTEIKGNFKNEYITVKKEGFEFFVNRNFQDVFNRHFLKTSEYLNGIAAIADEKGWSIIGKDGLTKTLPSFPEIKQINRNLFETNKVPLYGIIDSQGKIIIEPIYEKITLVEKKIYQVIKNGEIHYFDLKGVKIY